jgi:hypothetical protein
MKPILHIKIPSNIRTEIFIKTVRMIKEKLLPNYEVIVTPADNDFSIKSEGPVINLNIGTGGTNISELTDKLNELNKLSKMANEFKEFAKAHPDIITDVLSEAGIPNKNNSSYELDNVGIGDNIPRIKFFPYDPDGPIAKSILEPKGTVTDSNINITSFNHVSESCIKPLPLLYDPFEKFYLRKKYDYFHRNFMPEEKYSKRCHDATGDFLDEYWLPNY